MKVPDCMGTYEEGDPSCDGGRDPHTGRAAQACLLRPTCHQFRDWCKENDEDPELYKGKTAEEIEARMDRVPDVIPDPLPYHPKGKPGRPKGPMMIPDECWDLLKHFDSLLRDRFGKDRVERKPTASGGRKVVFRPGMFYWKDRIERSRCLSWHCKREDGHDKAVACIHLRVMTKNVDIQLPYTLEELRKRLSKVTMKKISVFEFEDGPYQIVCRRLDREGVGLVIGAIKRLDELGDHPLPEVL